MSFSNIYPNLPGMMVEFKDGGMALRQDVGVTPTDSVLILGTAVDGPVLEPVAVDDQSVEAIFGKAITENGVSNGSTLVKAFRQARKRGCNDIRLMRVTGANAKCDLRGSDIVVADTKRIEEDFAVISGNDVTVLTLSNGSVIRDSAKVYVKGAQVLTGYTVNETDGEITIQAGVADAGAPVTVQYAYKATEKIDNEAHTVANLKVTLKETPVAGTTVVKLNSSTIANTDYSVVGKVVTFKAASGVANADNVTVTYSHNNGARIEATDSGHNGVQFITETSSITVAVKNTPKTDSVKLYVNGIVFANTEAIAVEYSTKEVTVDKKHFARGSKVTVEYLHETTEVTKTELKFESFFGGATYNQGNVEVVDVKNEKDEVIGKKIIIIKPENKRLSTFETALEYSSTDFMTFGLMADAITGDARNGIYKVSTDTPETLSSELVKTKKFFTDGVDGVNLSKQEMYEALSGKRDKDGYLEKVGAFQLLEDYQVDWITPVGVYADEELNDRNQNFAYELALLCAILSYRNKTTLGAIAMKPNRDTSLAGVQDYAKHIASFKNLFLMKDLDGNIIKDAEGQPMDLGKFLSVVAGPEIEERDSTVGRYFANAAVDYVALNTVLLPQSAPTNKVVPGAGKLRFNFSNAQLDAITGNRIVTFKSKTDRSNRTSIVVVDGITSAHPSSDYTRVTTPKSLRTVVDNVREVCDPFIGEPNTVEQRNALSSAISKRLSILKEKGVLLDSAFQIIVTAQDQVLGSAKIELTVVPPQELRKITTVVGLKANL